MCGSSAHDLDQPPAQNPPSELSDADEITLQQGCRYVPTDPCADWCGCLGHEGVEAQPRSFWSVASKKSWKPTGLLGRMEEGVALDRDTSSPTCRTHATRSAMSLPPLHSQAFPQTAGFVLSC